MALPNLSDAGTVATILGRPAPDAARVNALLALGSKAFRTATRQDISHVAGDVATLDADGSWCLLLPQVPVTAVTAVSVDGTALDADAYEWSAKGILRRCDGWPDGYRKVAVTYDHGYEDTPEDVDYAVGEWVAVRLTRDPGVLSVGLGAFSQTFDRAGVTETWTATVRAYKRLVGG